jgi:hypothetical protein
MLWRVIEGSLSDIDEVGANIHQNCTIDKENGALSGA